MSTATLTKPRHGGTQAAQTASVELPDKTARGHLVAKLSEFERACSELSEYAARAERASIDQERALTDPELTESEAAERISKAQNERNVYKARQGQREKAIASLSGELTSAIKQASGELQGLVNREVDRRREIIGARVLEVAGVTDTTRPGLKPALADLLDYSEPILLVQALAPRSLLGISGNSESLAQSSKDVLEKYTAVIAEAAKTI